MDIEKVIAQSEENIRQALQDYARHSTETAVMDDASDAFIHRLAKDNAYAKRELRELFSQSPVYDSKLDALVINGTRTHDPDPERIISLGRDILADALGIHEDLDGLNFTGDMMWNILYFFAGRWYSDEERDEYIEDIKRVAPKAYKQVIVDGVIYPSIAACARALYVDESTVQKYLNGTRTGERLLDGLDIRYAEPNDERKEQNT